MSRDGRLDVLLVTGSDGIRKRLGLLACGPYTLAADMGWPLPDELPSMTLGLLPELLFDNLLEADLAMETFL